jgi:hypothetical protein
VTNIKERDVRKTNKKGNKVQARDFFRRKIANSTRNNIPLYNYLGDIFEKKRDNLLLITKESLQSFMSESKSSPSVSSPSDDNSDLDKTFIEKKSPVQVQTDENIINTEPESIPSSSSNPPLIDQLPSEITEHSPTQAKKIPIYSTTNNIFTSDNTQINSDYNLIEIDIPGNIDPSLIHSRISTEDKQNKSNSKEDPISSETPISEEEILAQLDKIFNVNMSIDCEKLSLHLLPEKFNGEGEFNVHDFLSQITACEKLNGWDEAQKIKYFAKSLRGKALAFIYSQIDDLSEIKWEALEKMFLEQFEANKMVLEQNLLNMGQKEGEKPTDFATRVLKLSKRINEKMADDKIIQYVLKGLNDKCHTQISMLDNSTIEKLKTNLKVYEKNESLRQSKKDKIDILIEKLEKNDKLEAAISRLEKIKLEPTETTNNVRDVNVPQRPYSQSPSFHNNRHNPPHKNNRWIPSQTYWNNSYPPQWNQSFTNYPYYNSAFQNYIPRRFQEPRPFFHYRQRYANKPEPFKNSIPPLMNSEFRPSPNRTPYRFYPEQSRSNFNKPQYFPYNNEENRSNNRYSRPSAKPQRHQPASPTNPPHRSNTNPFHPALDRKRESPSFYSNRPQIDN